jgi:hypothetical protein
MIEVHEMELRESYCAAMDVLGSRTSMAQWLANVGMGHVSSRAKH